MSIASRIRWRRRLARIVPVMMAGRTAGGDLPEQRHVMFVWLGFVVQVAIARVPFEMNP